MSNPESFIQEVTEEVRRDRLYSYFRRYGWIPALIVLAIVGGTAWTEWSKAQATAEAQAFGDSVLDALDMGGAEARQEALSSVPADGAQKAVLALLLASDPTQDRVASLAALEALAADSAQPQSYRDLAVLRRVILAGADLPLAERRALLEPVAAAGRAFRPLALEQLAYLLVEEGNTDAAISALRALTQDQQAPAGLRGRAGQMIVALGGETAPAADAG
ncbi:hypothetical protein EEB11_00065 [Pseudotabrizicola sediminis]|uniref:Tetratricopeptide repeat-like domain-containing protein n=1 Tax=Pseudotabrizicola sediminis TaxID=2486418 RepID=A0ABY2KQK0_9RHOB|nr:hypothetical protein [Pseudotabrizicola sediminis]TGD45023.1 hypothetical protein EEB11_00065 [Pseudotabrizicola sediminis]